MRSKGDTLWVWQEFDGENWGLIVAQVEGHQVGLPLLGPTTIHLVARSEEVTRGMLKPLAERHYQMTGHPVRLARFELHGSEPLLTA